MSSSGIPKTMRALQLTSIPYGLEVREVPVPRPRSGEVLVRVHASPVNPSDVSFLQGTYGVSKDLPTIPGFEGAGEVVESGGGFMGWVVKGKRVAFAHQSRTLEGCWAEYAVVPAFNCVSIDKSVSYEQAASSFVNPLTALAMIDTIRSGKHRAAVHTAAASALGRMLLRLCAKERIPLICVVRRAEQVELLRGLGAEHVLDSSEEDFDRRLEELAARLSATVAFDAVAGDLAGRVVNAMPKHARLHVYGALSNKAVGMVHPGHLIFQDKQICGLWLTSYLADKNMFSLLSLTSKVQSLLKEELATTYRAHCSLANASEGIKSYTQNMTAGKVLICPQLAGESAADGEERKTGESAAAVGEGEEKAAGTGAGAGAGAGGEDVDGGGAGEGAAPAGTSEGDGAE